MSHLQLCRASFCIESSIGCLLINPNSSQEMNENSFVDVNTTYINKLDYKLVASASVNFVCGKVHSSSNNVSGCLIQHKLCPNSRSNVTTQKHVAELHCFFDTSSSEDSIADPLLILSTNSFGNS